MKRSRPTAIDLFCGAGGMSLGFEQAGFDVVAAFDVEEINIVTHRLNFPETSAEVANLAEHNGDTLRKLAGLGRTEIDVVFGGPPCQGFSCGGLRDIDDERNLLVFDFLRLVRQLEPKYFVMENVKGLTSIDCRPILESFVRRSHRAGYRIVQPIRVLNAADFGVPQRRWRTFVLGCRSDMPLIEYPKSDPGAVRPVVRDAISDLPKLEGRGELFESDIYRGSLNLAAHRYAKIMRGIVRDTDDRSPRRRVKNSELTGCLRTKHTMETIRRFANTAPGDAEPVSRYIRLDWNDVSPTIRAGTGVERGSHTAPRPIHPSVNRCISAREAARLHSIPDWFQFHGTRWHDFRQIGNSVPPLLARAVGASVRSSL